MPPLRIDVATPSRAYAVTIANGLLDQIASLLDGLKLPPRRFVVSSPLVWRLHGPHLSKLLGGTEPVLVPDGERYKHLATVTKIYDALLRMNAERSSTLITRVAAPPSSVRTHAPTPSDDLTPGATARRPSCHS